MPMNKGDMRLQEMPREAAFRLNFCLGNRCSIRLSYGTVQRNQKRLQRDAAVDQPAAPIMRLIPNSRGRDHTAERPALTPLAASPRRVALPSPPHRGGTRSLSADTPSETLNPSEPSVETG
jgi:hypothetical protein